MACSMRRVEDTQESFCGAPFCDAPHRTNTEPVSAVSVIDAGFSMRVNELRKPNRTAAETAGPRGLSPVDGD